MSADTLAEFTARFRGERDSPPVQTLLGYTAAHGDVFAALLAAADQAGTSAPMPHVLADIADAYGLDDLDAVFAWLTHAGLIEPTDRRDVPRAPAMPAGHVWRLLPPNHHERTEP